jgi:hypothetical protein
LNLDQLRERLRHENSRKLLARIAPNEIDAYLNDSGFTLSEGATSQATQQILRAFALAKVNADPSALGTWLASQQGCNHLNLMIGVLAGYEPEMAADVVKRSPLQEQNRRMAYLIMFSAAAQRDAERTIRVVETMQFDNQALKGDVIRETLKNASQFETSVERMAEVIACYSDGTLNAFPNAVMDSAADVSYAPVAKVLDLFPLDGQPWQRAFAMRFLEEKAHRGSAGDTEVSDFLSSKRSGSLTPEERQRLVASLGNL